MNRMPAISNDVPIGKRIKGDEMLSIMLGTARREPHERPFLHPRRGGSAEGEIRNYLLTGSIPIQARLATRKPGVVIRPSSGGGLILSDRLRWHQASACLPNKGWERLRCGLSVRRWAFLCSSAQPG